MIFASSPSFDGIRRLAADFHGGASSIALVETAPNTFAVYNALGPIAGERVVKRSKRFYFESTS